MSCSLNGNAASTYTYGADGLRRSSTVNGVTTYFVYDGQTMVREMKLNTTTNALYSTATYLAGPRGMEYRRDDTATEVDSQGNTVTKARWYVYDGLGSVVGEVDPLGNLTSSPKYDVYGAVRSNSGTASTKQGFVGALGHLSEPETGLIYMRARYYDPNTGRFISQDPAGNGNNWFVYADNNPVNNVDVTGKNTVKTLVLIATAIAFVAAIVGLCAFVPGAAEVLLAIAIAVASVSEGLGDVVIAVLAAAESLAGTAGLISGILVAVSSSIAVVAAYIDFEGGDESAPKQEGAPSSSPGDDPNPPVSYS